MTAKNQTLGEYVAEQMQRPAFREAWRTLEPEFSLIEQVIALRLKRGLTQAQLARRAGTKQPSIARLESGRSRPNLSFLRKVAAALDANVEIRLTPKPLHAASEPGRKRVARPAPGSTKRQKKA